MKCYKDFNVLSRNLQNVIGGQDTKVQKKIAKIFEKIKPTLEKFQEGVESLRLDNAMEDEKGTLLLDEKGGYKFSKDGIKTLTKQINDLENQEVEFSVLNVVNPQGLEKFLFLKDWTTGITFVEDEDDEEL